jgi:hypothetical protein
MPASYKPQTIHEIYHSIETAGIVHDAATALAVLAEGGFYEGFIAAVLAFSEALNANLTREELIRQVREWLLECQIRTEAMIGEVDASLATRNRDGHAAARSLRR